MAEPISIASGLVALITFALQSSKLLYQTVESFKSSKRTLRELREELEAFDGVLQSLQEAVTDSNVALASSLKLPLFRCGKACKEFEAVIVKCTAHSGGPRTSFRDWAKLKYMGDDIAGFKNVLAGYKSTITIALGDATMRTSAVTANVLKEYKEMIKNTTSDLEEHLQEIDDKLQKLSLPGAGISDKDAAERRGILEERDSTQQCLDICASVSTHMDKVRPSTFENITTSSDGHEGLVYTAGGRISPRLVTANAFKVCKENLTSTTTVLERHLQDINNRLQKLSSEPSGTSDKHQAEKERLEEEKGSIKQCLAICADASDQANEDRTNFFEDVTMANDGHQVVVSTFGDLVSAKRITVGDRSIQWLGQMSDETLQRLSRDRSSATTDKKLRGEGVTPFEDRYGSGVKLSSKSIEGDTSPQ